MRDFDFISAEHHARRTQKKTTKLRAGCASLLIAIMTVWTVAHFRSIQSAEAMITQIGAQRDELTHLLQKKAEMEARRAQLERQRQLVMLLEQDESLAVVFSDISRRIPQSVFLTSLNLSAPSVARWASATTDAPDESAPGGVPDRAPQARDSQQSARGENGAFPDVEPADRRHNGPYARLILNGVASQTSEIIRFAASLENSPIFARVQMRVRDSVSWADRRAESFELVCDLAEQVRPAP